MVGAEMEAAMEVMTAACLGMAARAARWVAVEVPGERLLVGAMVVGVVGAMGAGTRCTRS